jgi:hydroxyacylglutathione hydrolase
MAEYPGSLYKSRFWTSQNDEYMNILTIPVGQMQSNCYIVSEEKSQKCIIIDPGEDGEYIVSEILKKGWKPEKIIATHGHFDHIMSGFVVQNTLNIPFLINKDDEFLVNNMRDSARHFLGIESDPPPLIDGYIKAGEKILLGKEEFQVIVTPGHTPGSVCLYSKKEKIIFTGDLLFAYGGIGRTDFSYSNPIKMQESLKKVFSLPPDTIVYSGHGEETTIGREKVSSS